MYIKLDYFYFKTFDLEVKATLAKKNIVKSEG